MEPVMTSDHVVTKPMTSSPPSLGGHVVTHQLLREGHVMRGMVRNMVTNMETVLGDLQGIMGDIQSLVLQIDSVTDKIDKTCQDEGRSGGHTVMKPHCLHSLARHSSMSDLSSPGSANTMIVHSLGRIERHKHSHKGHNVEFQSSSAAQRNPTVQLSKGQNVEFQSSSAAQRNPTVQLSKGQNVEFQSSSAAQRNPTVQLSKGQNVEFQSSSAAQRRATVQLPAKTSTASHRSSNIQALIQSTNVPRKSPNLKDSTQISNISPRNSNVLSPCKTQSSSGARFSPNVLGQSSKATHQRPTVLIQSASVSGKHEAEMSKRKREHRHRVKTEHTGLPGSSQERSKLPLPSSTRHKTTMSLLVHDEKPSKLNAAPKTSAQSFTKTTPERASTQVNNEMPTETRAKPAQLQAVPAHTHTKPVQLQVVNIPPSDASPADWSGRSNSFKVHPRHGSGAHHKQRHQESRKSWPNDTPLPFNLLKKKEGRVFTPTDECALRVALPPKKNPDECERRGHRSKNHSGAKHKSRQTITVLPESTHHVLKPDIHGPKLSPKKSPENRFYKKSLQKEGDTLDLYDTVYEEIPQSPRSQRGSVVVNKSFQAKTPTGQISPVTHAGMTQNVHVVKKPNVDSSSQEDFSLSYRPKANRVHAYLRGSGSLPTSPTLRQSVERPEFDPGSKWMPVTKVIMALGSRSQECRLYQSLESDVGSEVGEAQEGRSIRSITPDMDWSYLDLVGDPAHQPPTNDGYEIPVTPIPLKQHKKALPLDQELALLAETLDESVPKVTFTETGSSITASGSRSPITPTFYASIASVVEKICQSPTVSHVFCNEVTDTSKGGYCGCYEAVVDSVLENIAGFDCSEEVVNFDDVVSETYISFDIEFEDDDWDVGLKHAEVDFGSSEDIHFPDFTAEGIFDDVLFPSDKNIDDDNVGQTKKASVNDDLDSGAKDALTASEASVVKSCKRKLSPQSPEYKKSVTSFQSDVSGACRYLGRVSPSGHVLSDVRSSILSSTRWSTRASPPAGLSGAGISGAGISGAGISGAGLSDAGISVAGISCAGLSGASLSCAGLSGAELSSAALTSSVLSCNEDIWVDMNSSLSSDELSIKVSDSSHSSMSFGSPDLAPCSPDTDVFVTSSDADDVFSSRTRSPALSDVSRTSSRTHRQNILKLRRDFFDSILSTRDIEQADKADRSFAISTASTAGSFHQDLDPDNLLSQQDLFLDNVSEAGSLSEDKGTYNRHVNTWTAYTMVHLQADDVSDTTSDILNDNNTIGSNTIDNNTSLASTRFDHDNNNSAFHPNQGLGY